MKRITCSTLLFSCLLPGSAATSADDLFSHSILKLPGERQTQVQWVEVIDTQQEWDDFYLSLYPPRLDAPLLPAIPQLDFENYMVVAGGLGYKSSGGHELLIDRVYDMGNSILVQAWAISPGPGCIVTMAVTYPQVAVLIPRTDKPVKAGLLKAITDCQ